MEQKPSVGRIIHVSTENTDRCIAAIITEVKDGKITAATGFNNTGSTFPVYNPRDDQWHWPERVE